MDEITGILLPEAFLFEQGMTKFSFPSFNTIRYLGLESKTFD